MIVYVGTQTFQKHVIWGEALIGLFQIVLGAQAPPTFVVRANQYVFICLASCDWTVLNDSRSTQQQLVSWQTGTN